MRRTLFAAACAASAAALVLAPVAAADSLDTGGSAADVVSNLQSEGYLVQINWIAGFDTKPLDTCWVTGVNNPGNVKPGTSSSAPTVYVDVQCPNHED